MMVNVINRGYGVTTNCCYCISYLQADTQRSLTVENVATTAGQLREAYFIYMGSGPEQLTKSHAQTGKASASRVLSTPSTTSWLERSNR